MPADAVADSDADSDAYAGAMPEPAARVGEADQAVDHSASAADWDKELRRRLPVHSTAPARRHEPLGRPQIDRSAVNGSAAAVYREVATPLSMPLRMPRRRPVRLTRRGRLVVWLLLLGLMIGMAMLLAPAIQAAPPAGPMRTVVVEPGDTLWSISTAALPSDDPYQAVDQVRRLNHMHDNSIFVGQQLTLPPAG